MSRPKLNKTEENWRDFEKMSLTTLIPASEPRTALPNTAIDRGEPHALAKREPLQPFSIPLPLYKTGQNGTVSSAATQKRLCASHLRRRTSTPVPFCQFPVPAFLRFRDLSPPQELYRFFTVSIPKKGGLSPFDHRPRQTRFNPSTAPPRLRGSGLGQKPDEIRKSP